MKTLSPLAHPAWRRCRRSGDVSQLGRHGHRVSPGTGLEGGRAFRSTRFRFSCGRSPEYVGFGTDAATIARLETVLSSLSEMGYRNVEPFTLSGLSAEDYRALLDKYGLKASPGMSTSAPRRAHRHRGGPRGQQDPGHPVLRVRLHPDISADLHHRGRVDRLRRSTSRTRRVARQGQTLMVHNHDIEFEIVFGDQTVFDILMANTDPRNVVFQLDLYWATNGGGLDNPLEVLERYGNRIQLFHVKDMAAGPFPGRIEIVGEGIIDFPEIFAATQGPVRYYVVEHDPRFGDRHSARSKPPRRASPTSAT